MIAMVNKTGQLEASFRHEFVGWQCRVRQHAMRQYQGRPSPGMRPRVTTMEGDEVSPAATVVLMEADPAESIAQFSHIVRKTHDPEQRHRDGLKLLSAAYFQSSRQFSGVMTALFAADSAIAERLAEAGACRLEFDQFTQRYVLPSAVAELDDDEPAYQATYWHNAMFNPALPAAPRILVFTPDWGQAAPSNN